MKIFRRKFTVEEFEKVNINVNSLRGNKTRFTKNRIMQIIYVWLHCLGVDNVQVNIIVMSEISGDADFFLMILWNHNGTILSPVLIKDRLLHRSQAAT